MKLTDKYLSFTVGVENFAVPLLTVREVIAMPDVTALPHAPPHVVGIMNLRGQIITIFDLRSCLKAKSESKVETTVIICDFSFGQMGLIVDSVASVLSARADKIAEVPPGSRASQHDFVTNVYSRDNDLILMLDVEKLLSREVKTLAGPQAQAA